MKAVVFHDVDDIRVEDVPRASASCTNRRIVRITATRRSA